MKFEDVIDQFRGGAKIRCTSWADGYYAQIDPKVGDVLLFSPEKAIRPIYHFSAYNIRHGEWEVVE